MGHGHGKEICSKLCQHFHGPMGGGRFGENKQKTLFYKRFLDDIFIIWTHGLAEHNKFFETLQNHHDSISLKFEFHQNEINFLDTTVYKGESFQREGILDTKVYPQTASNSYTRIRTTQSTPLMES